MISPRPARQNRRKGPICARGYHTTGGRNPVESGPLSYEWRGSGYAATPAVATASVRCRPSGLMDRRVEEIGGVGSRVSRTIAWALDTVWIA